MLEEILLFALLGVGAGAVYALMGLGVVVIYRGSGVINFAQGGVAVFATSVFVSLSESTGSPALGVLAGLGVAAGLGAGMHWLIMRPMADAPTLARVVATLGVLLGLNAVTVLVFGDNLASPPSLVPTGPMEIVGVTVGRDRIYLLAIAAALTGLLSVLYRYTGYGRLSRAASESELSLALLGRSPNFVSTLNWVLGCTLAAVAGILVAPITSLSTVAFALLIVPTLAAAAAGSFASFGLTLLGGIAIGVVQSQLTRFSPVVGLGDVVPFVVVGGMLLARGRAIPQRGDEAVLRQPPRPSAPLRPTTAVIGAVLATVIVAGLPPAQQGAATFSVVIAIGALSIVMITGLLGQISLAQMAFAGLGALVTARVAADLGLAFPIPILAGAVAMLPVGVLFGLPALRVRGLNLAVLTLTAAVAVNGVIFKNPDVAGGLEGLVVPTPELFGWSLDPAAHPLRYFGFCVTVLVLVIVAVGALRRAPFGRAMIAVSSSERAASMSGIGVRRTKVLGFSLAAAMAGLVGGLLTYQSGRLSFTAYFPLESILLLGLVAVVGVGSSGGAVLAGVLVVGGIVQVMLGDLVDPAWLSAATGVAVVVVSIWAPQGLVPSVDRFVRSLAAPTKVQPTVAAHERPEGSLGGARVERP